MGAGYEARTLVFSYGTLKKDFPNHGLLLDLISSGDAIFVGCYSTVDPYPLVCGPYRVPFLLNLPGLGHRISGELYAVSTHALSLLDELEGTCLGHYERLPIVVARAKVNGLQEEEVVGAEAYYAHRSYAEGLWKRCGEMGVTSYTEEVAEGYVKRAERPLDVSFLDHIHRFISSDVSDDGVHFPR